MSWSSKDNLVSEPESISDRRMGSSRLCEEAAKNCDQLSSLSLSSISLASRMIPGLTFCSFDLSSESNDFISSH